MWPIVAVFASPDFLDMGRVRVWARAEARGNVVLLTDDPFDVNNVLGRQLRCEGIVHGVMRTPSLLVSRERLLEARLARDSAMVAIATTIVLFGEVAVNSGSKTVKRY